MKRIISLIVLSILMLSLSAMATTPEMLCRQIAQREYPNNLQMQNHVYGQQLSAYLQNRESRHRWFPE